MKTHRPIDSILIVDDEQDIGDLLTLMLLKKVKKVESCTTFGDAVDLISSTPYDLIFVDLDIGGDSGFDLIRVIKKKSPKTDVVVISAQNSQLVLQTAKSVGAKAFMPKPFTKSQVFDIICAV